MGEEVRAEAHEFIRMDQWRAGKIIYLLALPAKFI